MFTNNSFPELMYSKRNFTQKTRTCRFKNVTNRSRFNRFDGRSMLKTFDKSAKNNDASWIYAKRINGSFHGSARKNIFQRFYPGQNPRPLFYSTHGDREKSTEILRISFSRVNGRVRVRSCLQIYIKDCLRGAISAATLVALSTELLTKDWCFHFTFNGTHFHSWIGRKLRPSPSRHLSTNRVTKPYRLACTIRTRCFNNE